MLININNSSENGDYGIASVVVGKNIKVKLFDGVNFQGNAIELEEEKSYSCLDKYTFNKIANSVTVGYVNPNKFY